MAIYGYTKNYKLIKPKYDTDTWHDYEYDNLDTIDAVLSAIYASGNWKGFWAANAHYAVDDIVIDRDTDTMYKVMVEHTTSEASFAAEQTAHPNYYELWSPNDLAESWATKTDGKVAYTDYSAKAYAVSSGLINDGSAKEWAIGSGAIGNTGEYSAKKYATDAHNDYISMTTNPNVAAVGSNINNVNAVGQSISSVNTVASNVSSVNTVGNNISSVNTTASNMAAIQYAPTAAANAAQSATNAANSATISANSAIWAEGTDAQVAALGGVHSSKGWAEQSPSVNFSLTNTPYTTNRILEIPQDIKLELNNGTLTLKAGSKVYVPNGFEADGTTPKFDVVTLTEDKPRTGSITTTGTSMVYASSTGEIYVFTYPGDGISQGYFSGPTAPTGHDYMLWYDTVNNIIKKTDNGGSTWESYLSFPIAIVSYSSDSSGFTSIDQIFNGFGYIGSTVFVLPGVKYEFPNGLNSNGSYVNGFTVTTSVLTTTYTYTSTTYQSLFIANGNVIWRCGQFYVVENPPTSGLAYCVWYVQSLNCFYTTQDGTTVPKNSKGTSIIQIASNIKTDASFKVTSIDFETVDGLLTSNANNLSTIGRSYLSGLGMPSGRYIDLTLGASGSTYTAPANGYFCAKVQWKDPTSFLSMNNGYVVGYCQTGTGGATVGLTFVPVKKGDVVNISYHEIIVYWFGFVYAEGEN